MFDAGPAAGVYLLIVPAYGLALFVWLLVALFRSPHEAGHPFFTGFMYALAAFLPANFLVWLLAAPFFASAAPPAEISWTELDPPASPHEFGFAVFLPVWNLVVLGVALWLPFRQRRQPNPALERTSTAGDASSAGDAHTPQ